MKVKVHVGFFFVRFSLLVFFSLLLLERWDILSGFVGHESGKTAMGSIIFRETLKNWWSFQSNLTKIHLNEIELANEIERSISTSQISSFSRNRAQFACINISAAVLFIRFDKNNWRALFNYMFAAVCQNQSCHRHFDRPDFILWPLRKVGISSDFLENDWIWFRGFSKLQTLIDWLFNWFDHKVR